MRGVWGPVVVLDPLIGLLQGSVDLIQQAELARVLEGAEKFDHLILEVIPGRKLVVPDGLNGWVDPKPMLLLVVLTQHPGDSAVASGGL